MKNMIKLLAVVLSILMVLTLCVACAKKQDAPANDAPVNDQPAEQTQTPAADGQEPKEAADEGVWKDALYKEDTTLGEGATTFTVVVTFKEQSITFTINTDQEYLGPALVEVGLIEGTGGFYTVVNGITADWSVDEGWWNITKDGVDTSGADLTPVAAGDQYVFTYKNGF